MRKSKCFGAALVGCTSIFEKAWKCLGGSSQNASSIRMIFACGFCPGAVVIASPPVGGGGGRGGGGARAGLAADPVHAAGAGQRHEVRVDEAAVALADEGGGDLALGQEPRLDVADGAVGEVVPDEPHGRDVVLHRRGEHVGAHHESAVAPHGRARAVRGGG